MTTGLVGVFGWPVGHSISPAMHNAALRALGLDWVYLPLAVEPVRLQEAVLGLRALGFMGANVTIPHKVAIAAFMDELSAEAQAVGAVNTVIVREGRFLGHNTDAVGFLGDLAAAGYSPAGRTAAVLGAGGAARSVVYALARAGAPVRVWNRSAEHARRLLVDLDPHVPSGLMSMAESVADALDSADLVVNATSVGMKGGPPGSPLPEGVRLRAGMTAYDLVYTPQATPFLRQARAAGAQAIGGLGMLVRQGAEAFTIWTGLEAPVAVMERAARRALRRR